MDLIHHAITPADSGKPRIALQVERGVLAKRRWRGIAEDGRQFGFDMEHPMHDGDFFFETDSHLYVIAQRPEPLLEINIGDAVHSARVGWMIGNLHFPISIEEGVVHAPDDPAVRQLLEREHAEFKPVQRIFHPVKAVGGHHHHHDH